MRLIRLTDTDGIEFYVDVDDIQEIKDRRKVRTISFKSGADSVNVIESVSLILRRIKEAKR